jgi:hypothetical protein
LLPLLPLLPLLAKRRSWLSHRSSFALVIKHRRVKAAAVHSQPEQMLVGLWSLELHVRSGTEHKLAGPANGLAYQQHGNLQLKPRANAPIPSWSWEDFLRLPLGQPKPLSSPLFSIFGSCGHGVSLLPCNLAPTIQE